MLWFIMPNYPSWYNPRLKVLTVCAGGNVRSVTLARLLKEHAHHPQKDTIACGIHSASTETFAMLAIWADIILVAGETELFEDIPKEFRHKTYHVNIGPDVFGGAMAPGLVHILQEMLYHDKNLRTALGWEA